MKSNCEKEKETRGRQQILITDDSEINRAILADMLEEDYEIIEAQDGLEALSILRRSELEIDLVLLDIMMPNMDGFELLAAMNQYQWIEDIPVIMISAESDSSYVNRAYSLGVTDYISRPFDEAIVRRRVANTLVLYNKQKRLVQMVTDQIYEKENNNRLMINILSHIVEFRNGESRWHVLHIHAITELLLKRLVQKENQYHLTQADISLITMASALHDIGKISIPDSILNKPGKLTPEEFEVIKTHSMTGASMLQSLPFYADEPIVKFSYDICRWHHERIDGLGYPDGLKGDEIPIAAQIVALADVYDALISERVYKKAIPHNEAVNMILYGECGSFSPLLLECLVDVSDRLKSELLDDPQRLNHRLELQNISAELYLHKELSASERTLSLLEQERTKYQFFAMMSREIQFEYSEMTNLVNISDWGAKQLGLTEITMDPRQSEQLQRIFSMGNLTKLNKALRQTTPEHPEIQQDYQLCVNGELRWYQFICRTTWSSESEPQYLGALGKVIDVDEERNQYLKLNYMANHDMLTGLLNHTHAKEQILQRLIDRPNSKFALILIDLDNFKKANDSRGHSFGNYFLQHIAEKVQSCTNENDIAARVGGDEFLLVFEYNGDLKSVSEQILNTLCGEYLGFTISASIGVATTDAAGRNYDMLFRCANQALYAAKADGKGMLRLYDSSMKATFSAISAIEGANE